MGVNIELNTKNKCINGDKCVRIDWFWLPIFRTNLFRGPWSKEMKFQNKGAVLVQIALLIVSQPCSPNQCICMYTTDFHCRFSVLILFVGLEISRWKFRIREQFWYKLFPYLLVNPGIKISVIQQEHADRRRDTRVGQQLIVANSAHAGNRLASPTWGARRQHICGCSTRNIHTYTATHTHTHTYRQKATYMLTCILWMCIMSLCN